MPQRPRPIDVATDPPAAGQSALARARVSWDKGDYDVAEPLYAEAIDTGGLTPVDTLDAYVHLGCARAVLGKKAGALAAFKMAALLDVHFDVPAEAGKRAATAADQARDLQARTGPLVLHAAIPDAVAAGSSAHVDVTLDAGHASLPGSRLGIHASDRDGRASHVDSVRAARAASFDLPAALSLPSATLRVRVDWLDGHANRLASLEESIHVKPLSATDSTPALAIGATGARAPDDGRGRGFWHTAWPYILGSAALAAGGVAVYFAGRSGDDVNVTGVRVVTH